MAQIGNWYDFGFNSEEEMSPNLIGPKLEKTWKLTKDKNVIEETETEESELDSAE